MTRPSKRSASRVELIASGGIKTAPLITHRFPLERYAEAYRCLDSQSEQAMKVIIEVGDA